MNRSDFRFSEANEFNPNFGFAFSSTASRSAYGRTKPRLTKLRKPKSSFLGEGADSGYNPFRKDMIDGAGRGKVSGVSGLTVDKTPVTEVLNGVERLNVRENGVSGSGGGSFASYFEFGSSKNLDRFDSESGSSSVNVLPEQLRKLNMDDLGREANGKYKMDNYGYGGIRTSVSGINGSTEAMLAEKMENVRIKDGVGVSDTGAAVDPLSRENFKNGANIENKENLLFRGTVISIPTASQIPAMPPTCQSNGGPGGTDGMTTPFVKYNLNRRVKFVPKRHAGKNSNLKKKVENLDNDTESRVDSAPGGPESVSKESSSRPESPPSYSPMDMSPHPETVAGDQHSNETPMAAEETLTQGDGSLFSESNNRGNPPIDEDLVYATQQLNIGEVCINVSGTNIEDSEGFAFQQIGEISPEDCASGTETESFKTAPDDLDFDSDNSTSATTKICSSSNSGSDGPTSFYSIRNSESTGGTKFTFTASTSSPRRAIVQRPYKKINRRKGFDSCKSTATSKPSSVFSGGQQPEDSLPNNVKINLTGSQLKGEKISSTTVRKEASGESSGTPVPTTVAQETCENWRLRGNQAYASGDPSKAEEYYTQGVNSIPNSEKSQSCLRALVLCYSNRAATRMSLSRLREAVEDCKLAAGIDPTFLKAHVRAANCFLALGEVEEASKYFKYCLQPGISLCADTKILAEASEGLQKAQKAAECMSRSVECIQRGNCSDAENALILADKALTISFYSEKLLEIKAEAFFLLQKYSKVIQLCQESLDFAERNSNIAAVAIDPFENSGNAMRQGRHYFRLWRCHLMLKSYFFLGKLEEALSVLEGHESLRKGSETLESLIPFVAAIRELIHYKAAGNEAFQSGKYSDAIEHYSAALLFNVDSRPFAAICFCNRAAAYKALGKIIDAIADCNLAIALEGDYIKAISRRASLYESIRDYGQAARDMEKIISILMEKADASYQTESHEKPTKSGIPIDLRQAQLQLARLEEEARKDIPLNFYIILGIESSASAAEVKKAYRQAALKHHPDKAGQILAKGISGRNGTWKEIAEEIHSDADRLFKLIGEAYTTLLDPAQRSRYDN